jgi:hypothetical protein
MKVVRINVTQADIDEGVRCDSFSCPIARAAQRVLGLEVSVTPRSIKDHGTFLLGKLPPRAAAFVHNFDLSNPVKPFAFSVTLRPDASL